MLVFNTAWFQRKKKKITTFPIMTYSIHHRIAFSL